MYRKIVLYILIAISALSLEAYSKSGSWGVTGELQELYYSAAFHDDYANFINPAIISNVDQTQIMLSVAPKVLGASTLFNAGVFVPIGINHTVGVSYIGNGIWNIPLINNTGDQYGESNLVESTIYGSYAWRFLPFLSAGINVTAYNKNISSDVPEGAMTSGWAVGGDLGFIFNPLDVMNRGYSSVYRGELNVGVTFKNLFNFMKLKYEEEREEEVAKNVIAGLHYGWRQLFDVSVYANIADIYPKVLTKENNEEMKISNNINADLRVKVHPLIGIKTGWVNDGIKGGVDFSYKKLGVFKYLQLDYDLFYKPGDYIFVHNVKLITKVGPTREEMYARSLFDVLKLAPNDLYKRALAKYQEKKYWESAWLFSELVTKYPRYYLVDAAAYYLAEDFEKLGLDVLARETYSKSVMAYTSSDYLDKYNLGLQNLDYKNGDYESSMKYHKIIEEKYPTSTILGESYYIAAQVKFQQNDLDASLELLSRVKNLSEAYMYSLYTKAVIYAIQSKYDESLKTLTELRTKVPNNNAQKLLINRAHVLAGHILQEKNDVKGALEEYMKVTSEFPGFDEVQLALAWGFLKYQKTDAALGYANNLINSGSNSVHIPEAYLVKGFASHMSGNYTDAVTFYDEASKLAESKKLDEATLSAKKSENEELLSKDKEYQEELKSVALSRGVAKKGEKQANLKAEYDNLSKAKIEYDVFAEEMNAVKKFVGSKSQEKIINDAAYAKANALTKIQESEKQKVLDEAAKEAERKAAEIKAAEEELKRLEQELQ